MGGVHLIGTEHAAGSDHTARQLALFHHAGLNRGGLGSQHHLFIDIEGILLILGRMIGRDVQLLEVVLIVFHLRSFYHLVAHADENAFHFFQRDGCLLYTSFMKGTPI